MAIERRGFGVGEAIGYGWRGFKANVGPLLAVTLVVIVVNVVLQGITRSVNTTLGDIGAQLLSLIVGSIVSMGLVRIALTVVDGGRPKLDQLMSTDQLVPYIITSVLLGIAVTIGLILFIIPGIYIALRWGYATYAVIDEGLGVADAFERSSDVTEGHRLQLLVLGIALLLLNLLGLLVFLVGVLVTGAITWVVLAFVWRRISGRHVAEFPG